MPGELFLRRLCCTVMNDLHLEQKGGYVSVELYLGPMFPTSDGEEIPLL